ncbi:g9886 [Coccomyxa viridis]|uniref:G9886 protein n=1 Tax=Coccomyxa viridis TaxID=1274662 RepID=A0ABP1G465_9CHLO
MKSAPFAAYIALLCLALLAWILTLAGNAALNQVCEDSCRYYFGLSWWVTWFELLILLATIPVAIMGIRVWRPAVLALLAVNTALSMTQADSWLQSKGIDPYYSLFPDRCNVLIAGFIALSIINLLLILVLGMSDAEVAPKQPANSAYSNSPPPHTTPTYPPRG